MSAPAVAPQSLVGSHSTGRDQTDEEERNLAVVSEFLAEQRPLGEETRRRFLAKDYKSHRLGMLNLAELAGLEDADSRPHTGYNADSFSDRRNELVDIVAHGDVVWTVFRLVGTHTGPFWGQEGTGAPLDTLEVAIFRLAEGRVSEAWFMNDELALCRQLGIAVDVPNLA
ncbi:SnoaL-like polyketide cyclase [Sinosporangium album]|uniref:SnoaL-like polyketide cyclase n=1 Tax=Sinosporangium album TaxID=504805 RepID=A0A1G8BJ34_9ACTN|nr:ester cyclase [Sinosporangium album]SDH33073.1 SnoaL-like polyketide cyclase [Sinosporangium album]